MEEFVTLIQGPAAATVLMGAILYTAYKFVLDYVIPRIDAALKESNERYKEMLTEHKADREAWLQSIDKISERIDRMSEVTDDMAKTVENLHSSVTAITQQLQNERKV
jgi:chromosome segregation ATPase